MKGMLTTFLVWMAAITLFAGNPTRVKQSLDWQANPITEFGPDGNPLINIWRFEGAVYNEAHPSLPYFAYQFPVEGPGTIQVQLLRSERESFPKAVHPDDEVLQNTIVFQTSISKDRKSYLGNVQFIPIVQKGPSSFERLTSFELRVEFIPGDLPSVNRNGFTDQSVLSEGQIFKIAVEQDGIYKMDYAFLADELGVPVESIDPRNIQLFGNGGGMLPEQVIAERYDDLVENAILVSGELDGSFDNGDFILFHGQGPGKWTYNEGEGEFDYQMNVYDTRNYYFLRVGVEAGRRISTQESVSGVYTSTTFNDYSRFEEDQTNLLHEYDLAQGSGRQWFGDYYKNQRSFTYNDIFDFKNIINSEPVKIRSRFAARTDNASTKFQITIDQQTMVSTNFGTTNLTNPNAEFARDRTINTEFTASAESFPVTVEYPSTGGNSEGWLDYIQFNVRRELKMAGNTLRFRDVETMNYSASTFVLENVGNGTTIWDITDPLVPRDQEYSNNGNNISFGAFTANQIREFIAFNSQSPQQPIAVGNVSNQNYHGIDQVDMVIIYHEDLKSEAERLADHRSQHDGLDIALVRIDLLFNEFSSGRKDATAIRDFAKMLYERTDRFRYLLLFGDGSYDHRNINSQGNNYVLTYQTNESLDPIFAFPSDDYFGLLDDLEGTLNSTDALDIAIGRIPVQNPEEATDVVDKIINYDTSSDALGDWRNRVVFVGDDEDNGIHTSDADNIADDVSERYPNLNVDKIYVDAYNQIPTPGGERVPSATEALNNNMFKGVLAVTYLGHGGSKGWAQERILQIPDITSWTNFDKLPIYITATCTFSGYDDAGFTTAGELVLLNKRGGAIALYTTTRAVYASTNEKLTRAACDTLFAPVNFKGQPLGEALRAAKNKTNGGTNSRKFVLLGDPSMRLAIPQYQIVTTKINGIDLQAGQPDTIRALQKVTVEGEVRSETGNLLTDFNGTLFPTIFDKEITLKTLGQDGTPIREYALQKNTLFKGRATVTNGKFQFTFVVPKDINFNFGNGKISYYAENGANDAAGNFDGLIIGGTDADALADDQGPKVEVFMNSEDFVFGGITSPSPTLLVQLEDDNGINVVGNSIGHDLTAVLDANTQSTYLLNDFYESELDNYTRGEVRYPLSELADGRHTMRVKAWDVANNSAEGYTEFVVASTDKVALEHVLNYPNPFIDATCFQFEHNMENQEFDVRVQIYTVSGRLVKTIEERIFPTSSRLSLGDCIEWDGKDDFGDPLARGVYLYKVLVQTTNTGSSTLNGESEFEKLVILR
jgi:hypothetical protein